MRAFRLPLSLQVWGKNWVWAAITGFGLLATVVKVQDSEIVPTATGVATFLGIIPESMKPAHGK